MAWPDDEIFKLKGQVARLEERIRHLEKVGTPRGLSCAHRGNCITDPEDEVFEERRGCLDCNQWLEPVRLKRR